MIFQESNIKAVDFSSLKQGNVANATLTSFHYRSGYCFATVTADSESVQCIIGNQSDYPIKDMLAIKGIEVKVTYLGTKASNGVTYPRYALEF